MIVVVMSKPDFVLAVLAAAFGAFDGAAVREARTGRLLVAGRGEVDVAEDARGAAVRVIGDAGLADRVWRVLQQHFMMFTRWDEQPCLPAPPCVSTWQGLRKP